MGQQDSGRSETDTEQSGALPDFMSGVVEVPVSQLSVAELLGKVLWLLMESPEYKFVQVEEIERLLKPSLAHGSFAYFEKAGEPFMFFNWVSLTEDRYKEIQTEAARLRPIDWNGGEMRVLLYALSPWSHRRTVADFVRQRLFDGGALSVYQEVHRRSGVAIMPQDDAQPPAPATDKV